MKHKFILSLDPSGNFHEGKGVTGWCLLDGNTSEILDIGSISSLEFSTMEKYWQMHIVLIEQIRANVGEFILVIEDYLLYNSKKDTQINSRMETPKLIGALQLYCYQNNIEYKMQPASEVKNRWADSILVHKGYIVPKGNKYCTKKGQSINRHMKDAIRHAVHYYTFKNKED